MVVKREPYAVFLIALLGAALLALQGCSNEYEEDIAQRYKGVKQRLADLDKQYAVLVQD